MPKKSFPTEPDDAGFFFASQEDQDQEIRTKRYPNGSEIKELKLSGGQTAVVRKLRGRDFVETKKMVQGSPQMDFETVNMSVAVTIDGEKKPPEYYLDDLFQADYSKLIIAYGILNFQ